MAYRLARCVMFMAPLQTEGNSDSRAEQLPLKVY